MGRFSFGTSEDLSVIFADLYRQDAARQQRERNAEDQNVINQWETGEISDEEFYAYAQQRIANASDAEERSQWEIILRNAHQENEGEVIQDTAEDIMDGIDAGTRTWDDLLAYYKSQKRKLKPSDPLYRELSDQINQVEDQIRANAVNGALGSIEYRYRSGQISGAQAGQELRALAARYKSSDPQRYYQLLGQALDMETGAARGGGSRGGGSGGSGGSGAGLGDTINQLEGYESRLLALSKQARDGQRVGQVTVPDGEGGLTTETFRLLNADGSVTPELRALHQQTLALYDELESAHLADGNVDAAGEDAERRSAYILEYVQPANTVSKERQWDALTGSFMAAVQAAANAESPALAWRDILTQANRMGAWASRLNTRTTSTDVQNRASDAEVRDNPELSAAARRSTTTEETDISRRTTPTFEEGIMQQIQVISEALNSGDPAAIAAAFENLPEGSPLADAGPLLAQVQTVRIGLSDGSMQMVMTPEGPKPLQIVQDQIGLDENGQPRMVVSGMVDAAGNLVWQRETGDDVTTVIGLVNGQSIPMLTTTQQQEVLMQDFTWKGVTYRRGTVLPKEVADDIKDAPVGTPPPPIGQMRVTQLPGGETFYGIDMPDGSIGWYRNRVPRRLDTPALPAPYTGPAEVAQRTFQRLGLDPTGRAVLDNAVQTGNRVSMRAYDQFAGANANIQQATSNVGYSQGAAPRVVNPGAPIGQPGYVKNVLPDGSQAGFRQVQPLSLAQTLSAARGGTDATGGLREFGQSLGIRGLGERPQRMANPALNRTMNIDVARPHINLRPVQRPNVDVAGLRAMRSRILANVSRFRGTSLGRSGRATTPNIGRRLEAI